MFESYISDYLQRKLSRFPPSHHSSPLVYYPQRHILQLLAGDPNIKRIKLYKITIRELEKLFTGDHRGMGLSDDPSRVYVHFLRSAYCESYDNISHENDKTKLFECLEAVVREVKRDLTAVSDSHPALSYLPNLFRLSKNEIKCICQNLSGVCNMMSTLQKLRQTIQQNHLQNIETITTVVRSQDLSIYCVLELIVIVLGSDSERMYLLNFAQILMLLDTVTARFMVKFTCEIHVFNPVDNLPDWCIIQSVYQWGDDLLMSYGVNAYSVIGEFESHVTGVFVTFPNTDPLELGQTFIDSILITAKEIEDEYNIPVIHTVNILTILRSILSVNWLSEIFGIRKHWGNPMVDAAVSGKAVQDKVDETLPISASAHIRLLASFNRMITLEYIKQHGCWPECVMIKKEEEEHSYPLYRAWLKRSTRLPETHPDHQHLHWALQKFLNNCVLDTYEDDLQLISDKSVSVRRHNLDALYVRSLTTVDNIPTVQESRRLILEYIRKTQMSVNDIFKIVMCGAVPSSWLANSAAMKGTEMKHLKARIFAVLTYELRQYFSATEDILKANVFRYNPHQTMTMNETELLKRLNSVTKQLDPESDSRYLSVIHIVDFSKWNLRMRYDNTHLIFKSIDDFIGCPGLIERSHILFSEMVNLVQDPFNPPAEGVANTESDTIWRFHNCGWEGQRQKGWTLLTSALLSDIARLTGINSIICGQGDNQTLLSQFPIPDKYRNSADWIKQDKMMVRRILDDFYCKLEIECSQVGLKIKTAESCRSLCYFNYSKRLYFNGVELSMTLKRIAKIMTEPNDSYPTSEFILKTIEGSAFAAALFSHPSILPYVTGRFSIALQIYNCYADNQLVKNDGQRLLQSYGYTLESRWLGLLMKIPASLGGIPQLNLVAYLLRGHPDPLCTDLVMLVLRIRSGCVVSRTILKVILSKKWFNKNPDVMRSSLILSPYSLNLNLPQSARSPLDEEILPALRDECKNTMIQDMFSLNIDHMAQTLLDVLSSMEPFQPVVANDIFSRTIPGRRQTFISGLTNTTSLGRLVYDNADAPLIERIAKLEYAQLNSWFTRTRDIMSATDSSTVVIKNHWSLAQWCRDNSWGCEVVGITVPHPIEQFSICLAPHDTCTGACCLCEPEHIVFVKHSENLINLPGLDGAHVTTTRSRTGDPYLGSTITEGIVQKTINCLNPDSTWRDVIRLNTLRHWVSSEGTYLDTLISDIIHTRTDIMTHTIEAATGIPSRLSYNHRAALMAVIHSCSLSSTTNMHSRIYISSNRMGEYSHGEINYHMPFGPAFLCFQQLICLNDLANKELTLQPIRTIYHAHVRDKDVPAVFDGKLDVRKHRLLSATRLRPPKILFASQSILQFTLVGSTLSSNIWTNPGNATHLDSSYAYASQLIGDSFIRETSVRESITLNLFHGFSAGSKFISTGDVKLIGVDNFISLLAWNFLILAPYNVWYCDSHVTMTVLCHQFIDGFTPGFWGSYTAAFGVEQLNAQLLRVHPEAISYNFTRSLGGVITVLKLLISIRASQLFKQLRLKAKGQQSTFNLSIYAPSITSLRLLWSKYVELLIIMALSDHDLPYQTSVAYARDFSANILGSADSCLHSVMSHVKLDYHLLLRKLNISTYRFVETKFIDLKEPWIDRLRFNLTADDVSNCKSETELQYPLIYPSLGRIHEYLSDSATIYVQEPVCCCPEQARSVDQHSESYFTRSGYLSKSHLRFLDIIFQEQLCIEGVIVLGSSTGTEALAISKFASCSRIYVNCYHQISTFSPHMAGSYIPPAFVLAETASKLISPSSAVLSSCDLMQTETMRSLYHHVRPYYFSGVTCDVEVPFDFPFNRVTDLVFNVLKLSSDLESIDWLIIKVPIKCEHELAILIGLVGRIFRSVKTFKSIFSRPRANLFYIVGNIKARYLVNENYKTETPVKLTKDVHLKGFLSEGMNQLFSPLFYASALQLESRKWVNTILPSSLCIACHSHISGWGHDYLVTPSRVELVNDIDRILTALSMEATQKLQMFHRTHQEANLPRSAILQIEHLPLHIALDKLFEKMNRLQLLKSLLSYTSFNLNRTISDIEKWCAMSHQYPLTTRPYVYYLDATRLINYSSRHIYEILGHVYDTNCDKHIALNGSKLFHSVHHFVTEVQLEYIPQPYKYCDTLCRSDLSWEWCRRSEISFWLLAGLILDTPINVKSPNSSLLTEFHLQNMLDKISIYDSNEHESADVIWIDSKCTVQSVIQIISQRAVISAPLTELSHLCQWMKIINTYKIPWTGIFPTRVCFHVLLTDDVSHFPGYPDLRQFINAYHPSGRSFIGCCCVDCSTEVLLTTHYGISHSMLDRMCSLGRIESVRDKTHTI